MVSPFGRPNITILLGLMQTKAAVFYASQDLGGLKSEWDDERRREEARTGREGKARFVSYVDSLVGKCRWWPTAGADPHDFRQQCLLAAFEALAREDGFAEFERPGEAATLLLCRHERDRIRARDRRERRRVKVFAEQRPTTTTPEDQLLAVERRQTMGRVLPEMEAVASKAQRQWLERFDAIAVAGDRPLVAAQAAREMGRNRSSATRALDSLQKLAMTSEAARYLLGERRPASQTQS